MALATLTIDINAKLANIERDLGKVAHLSEQSAARMSRAWKTVGTAMASIGGGAALVGFLKSSIDAADALTDLSVRTGLAVETLAGLKWAAHIGDISMESLATAVGRLNKAMGEAQLGNKDITAAFERLGVTARDPEQALIQLADAVARMPDPTQRATELSKLLGKSYQELLPLLNEGGAGIEALMRRGRELNPITTEMAQRAAEFNDKLDELTRSFQAVGIIIADKVLPPLIKLLDEMRDGTEIAGSFYDSIRLFGLGIDPFKSTTDSLGKLQDELAKFRAAQKAAGALGATVDGYLGVFSPQQIAKEIEDREKQIEFLNRQRRRELTDQYGWSGDARDNMATPAGKGVKRIPFGAGGSGGKSAKAGGSTFDPEGDFLWAVQESNEKSQRAWHDERARQIEQEEEAMTRLRDKYTDLIDPLQQYRTMLDEIDQLEAAGIENGGLSAAQALEARWKVNEALDDQIDKMQQISDAAEKQSDIARDLGLSFSSAFEDAIVEGKKLSDVLQSLAADISRIITRKLVTEPLAAGISGAIKGFDFGSLWPFAAGGVMTGAGPLALHRYAAGGIANSPQLALFGEGSRPEAYVPLPDGRRIPVAMQGGGGVAVHNTFTINGPTDRRSQQQIAAEVGAAVERAMRRNR